MFAQAASGLMLGGQVATADGGMAGGLKRLLDEVLGEVLRQSMHVTREQIGQQREAIAEAGMWGHDGLLERSAQGAAQGDLFKQPQRSGGKSFPTGKGVN